MVHSTRQDVFPKIALLCFCLALFTISWDKILCTKLAGFTFRISHVFLLSALATSLASNFRALPRWWAWPTRYFAAGIFLLTAYYFVTAQRGAFPLKSYMYSVWMLFDLAAFWLVSQLLPTDERSHKIVLYSLLSTIAFHGGVVFVDSVAFRFGFVDGLIGFNQNSFTGNGISRPHAFSYEPSYLAMFLSLGLGLVTPRILSRGRMWCWLALGLGLLGVILTTSRTGILFIGAYLILFSVLSCLGKERRELRKVALLWAVMVLAILLGSALLSSQQMALTWGSFASKIAKGEDGSGSARLRTNLLALTIGRETRWLGCGFGASLKYALETSKSYDVEQFRRFGTLTNGGEIIPSTWGQLIAEGGLPATLLYLFAMAAMINALRRAWAKTGDTLLKGGLCSAIAWTSLLACLIGNIARGDVWIYFALWSYFVKAAFDGAPMAKAFEHRA